MNIVYNIIKKHKGDIHVESTVGKGSTFIIRLPAGSILDDEEQPSVGPPISQEMSVGENR